MQVLKPRAQGSRNPTASGVELELGGTLSELGLTASV